MQGRWRGQVHMGEQILSQDFLIWSTSLLHSALHSKNHFKTFSDQKIYIFRSPPLACGPEWNQQVPNLTEAFLFLVLSVKNKNKGGGNKLENTKMRERYVCMYRISWLNDLSLNSCSKLQRTFFQMVPTATCYPHGIAFWVLGHQLAFIAICSILRSHDHNFWCLPISGVCFQFLAKNGHWIKWICLMTTVFA